MRRIMGQLMIFVMKFNFIYWNLYYYNYNNYNVESKQYWSIIGWKIG